MYSSTTPLKTYAGTPSYMAPEITILEKEFMMIQMLMLKGSVNNMYHHMIGQDSPLKKDYFGMLLILIKEH